MSDNTTPAEPPMWHGGQAWSREMASEALAAFDSNKDKVAAALNGDVKYQQERRNYYMLSRGMQPGGVPVAPSDVASVALQMTEREEQIKAAVNNTWAQHISMTPERKAELEAGTASKEWIDHARREIQRMKRDTEFCRKLTAGDMECMDRWSRMHKLGYGVREVNPQTQSKESTQ